MMKPSKELTMLRKAIAAQQAVWKVEEALVKAVWPDGAPANASKELRNFVSVMAASVNGTINIVEYHVEGLKRIVSW